jgi:hypothetical protein
LIEVERAGSGAHWLATMSLRQFLAARKHPRHGTFDDPAFVMIGTGTADIVSAS